MRSIRPEGSEKVKGCVSYMSLIRICQVRRCEDKVCDFRVVIQGIQGNETRSPLQLLTISQRPNLQLSPKCIASKQYLCVLKWFTCKVIAFQKLSFRSTDKHLQ